MSNLMSTLQFNGGEIYEIADATARTEISELSAEIGNLYTKDETYSKEQIDEMFANFSGSSYSDAEEVAF